MRFRKNVPAEHREVLKEQLKQYKKEMNLTKEELRELERWVSSGHSPYDNGNLIYGENGWPLDYVSALRAESEMLEWFNGLSEEEREKYLQELRSEHDTASDDVNIIADWYDSAMDPDAEMPFI